MLLCPLSCLSHLTSVQFWDNHSHAGGYAGSRYPFLTSKERDVETGLDYFLARYYSSTQGRFASPDEFRGGAYEFWLLGDPSAGEKQAFPFGDIRLPQSLNKYQYCFNNPLKFIDPNGHDALYIENKDTGKTTIVIPVHFTGPSATPGLIAEVVSRASQIDTGDPNVKIEIVATDKPIHGVLNTMNQVPKRRRNGRCRRQQSSHQKQRSGGWRRHSS